MLAIQCYRFLIGSKIPFSDWPQIVQTFLEQQSLHYQRFLYYFEDNYGGLPKAIQDCAQMAPIRMRPGSAGNNFYLSNIEDGTGCTEAEIMALMPKIYRRYGFSKTHIIYQDIDFFSQNIPAIVQAPGNTPDCIKGSGITLYRDSVFPRWSSIDLRIIINDGQKTLDPTPYFHAMRQLLPGVRYMGYVECCMSDEEQNACDILNADATVLLEAARSHLGKLLPSESEQPLLMRNTPKLSVAPVLKKMCKQYGYTYVKYEYHTFFIQRRTANGHYILLDIDVGPTFQEVNSLIRYIGAGFDHRIAYSSHSPLNQADLENYLSQCFHGLRSAEEVVFPALDAHFPPTPDWFAPIM